jgi:hypothetical protein
VLYQLSYLGKLERVMGIEPTLSAWKAEVLPLNYTRKVVLELVEGEGFEPSKAEPTDLQSVPFGRSGTPPNEEPLILLVTAKLVKKKDQFFCSSRSCRFTWQITRLIHDE